MPESMTPCANCPHPFAEHAEIEGIENRGHCKVPSCPCGAFDEGEGPTEDNSAQSRYVVIARATDMGDIQGCQLSAKGVGQPPEVPDSVLHQLGAEVKREYCRFFGEEPIHVAVTRLPFLARFDEPDDDAPAAAGIALDDEATVEEALKAIEQGVEMFANMPPEVH